MIVYIRRLTELIYKPKMSNLDSKDSNYLNTLVNKTFIDGLTHQYFQRENQD